MIAAAIRGAYDTPRARAAHGYHWHPSSQLPPLRSTEMKKRLKSARRMLLEDWSIRGGTNSSTYGLNDILTLSWYLDLFHDDPAAASLVTRLSEIVVARSEKVVGSDGNADATKALNDGYKSGERESGSTLYILLRFVRCERVLTPSSNDTDKAVRKRFRKKAYEQFQAGLRDQLSFSEVGDSRFDPCELAFCLEGMLHLRPETVDDATAERVFTVIFNAQERAPGWRPQTPLTTSHRGEVLYPIGIEAATSILSSLSILDGRAPKHRSAAMGHRHLRLLLKYWDWLKSRHLTLTLPSGDVTGWRSDRLGGSFLHIWENSQILEFLVIFRDYIDRHIAGELLELSELDVILPPARSAETDWPNIVAKFEPVTGHESYQVYHQIGRSFVQPRLDNAGEVQWSMLLYGPPGTGKTTMAQNLAAALNAPLIRISVSDFLTTGDAHMERRAKLIFEVLKRQMFAVVLFDELDQFLLDRDSELFQKQQSAFQLLTPGMLTKIADLRDRQSVVFVLATNYDDRIDSAIKRPGRVDISYLVLPPDLSKRKSTIKAVLDKRGITVLDEELAMAARSSVFLGHSGIVRVAKQVTPPQSLIVAYDKEPRDIQFNKFAERARALLEAGKTPDELVGLTMMALEAFDPGKQSQPRFVERLASLLRALPEDDQNKVREAGDFPKSSFKALVAIGKDPLPDRKQT